MMGKILVTGGAGYIGSHTILEILAAKNREVISADNYSNSTAHTFERINAISGCKVTNYAVDLCNMEATKKVFSANPNITGVIHFAAFKSVPESVKHPLLYYHNNIASLVNILACAKEFNVPHVIFSSSCSVYGNVKKLPVTEGTLLGKAVSPYGATKQIGEAILKDFTEANPLVNVVALRYFNPAGAHPSGKIGEVHVHAPDNLVPIITGTAIGKYPELVIYGDDYPTHDGTCVRDYVHVCDIARAHIDALHYLETAHNPARYSLFNLGMGNGVSVLEMVKSFERVSGKKLPYKMGKRRHGDVAAIYTDNTKAKSILGWGPHFSLDDIMRSAWAWAVTRQKESDEHSL